MTSYINQTIARHHVDELIAQAGRARVRRELRQGRRAARRAARQARRDELLVARGASNALSNWPTQVGYAGAR